eukprot:3131020-Pleurochrysis_carterae.AAC.1
MEEMMRLSPSRGPKRDSEVLPLLQQCCAQGPEQPPASTSRHCAHFQRTLTQGSSLRSALVWETPVRCTATVVELRVAARQRGACFEA